jgi:small subunit ribosomal protein S16
MLVIRLQRVGRKNDPNFRVVVTDSRNGPKSGSFLEIVGYLNPKTKKTELKNDRIKNWILKGAQLSPRVHNMCVDAKIIDSKKINVVPKPKAEIKEETAAPAEDGEKKEEKALPETTDKTVDKQDS